VLNSARAIYNFKIEDGRFVGGIAHGRLISLRTELGADELRWCGRGNEDPTVRGKIGEDKSYKALLRDIEGAIANPKPWHRWITVGGRKLRITQIVKVAKRTYRAYGDLRDHGKVRCSPPPDITHVQAALRDVTTFPSWVTPWQKPSGSLLAGGPFVEETVYPEWLPSDFIPRFRLLFVCLTGGLSPWLFEILLDLLFQGHRRRERCAQYGACWVGRGPGKSGPLRESEVLAWEWATPARKKLVCPAIARSRATREKPRRPARYEFLAAAKELELIGKAKNGDHDAANELFLAHLAMVIPIAKKYAHCDITVEALIAAAFEGEKTKKGKYRKGFFCALNKFNFRNGARFSGLLGPAVEWAISSYVQKQQKQRVSYESLDTAIYEDDDGRPLTYKDAVLDGTMPWKVAEGSVEDAQEQSERIRKAARRVLSGRNFAMFEFRYFSDKSTAETATEFGISNSHARLILADARAAVLAAIEKQNDFNNA
jgi:RNA polymerase sigma factor (sigma-70 family)